MHKVRITILKTTFDSELAREYGAAGLGPCPMMKRGQVFMQTMRNRTVSVMKLGRRFISMYLHLRTAAERIFYFGDWIREPGVAIVSCNDGLRPVIMKLEATDIPSKLDYEPVLHSHS